MVMCQVSLGNTFTSWTAVQTLLGTSYRAASVTAFRGVDAIVLVSVTRIGVPKCCRYYRILNETYALLAAV